MAFSGWGLNQTLDHLNRTMWPFVEKMNTTDGIEGVLSFAAVPKTNDLLNTVITTDAGRNAYLGSRLWDKKAMLDRDGLLQTFRNLEPNGVRGLLVSGPAVRDISKIASTSVTPAWRRTYQHTAAAIGWPYRNTSAGRAARARQTEMTKILQDHAPNMGSYLNEADQEQPDPGQAFWGSNYKKLLELKRKLDPNGVFWCKPCIGFEDWSWDDTTGRLCRV